LRLTWASSAGESYRVQYTQTVNGTWENIATVASAGSSTTYADADSARLARPIGFYRIQRP
jgi:hypothetical protein